MKLSAKEFMASIAFDRKLYEEEIECSIAHAKMLAGNGIITEEETEKIVAALKEIRKEIQDGKLRFTIEHEDVHSGIHAFLTDKIGELAKVMRVGRGVNDQVVADSRLFLKKETEAINELLTNLLDTLEGIARENVNTIMPGYSHLQRSQPVTLAHHFLAYYQMFNRDRKRFSNCLEGINLLPPDCGASAGTSFDLDRTMLAEELGFDGFLPNAMDAASDRDFAMEFINCCAIAMTHLSRFCEDLILWDTVEFDFIEIDLEFCTQSKVMPQKRNLDVAELIRGKAGRVYGDLINLLTIFKGLPMTYNRDMQEDKVPVMDAANTLESSLYLFVEMIKTMKINRGNMQRAAKYGYMNATELFNYLSDKGIDSENSARIVGKVVEYAINHGKPIEELWLDDLKQFSQAFDSDVYDRIAIRNVIASKKSEGSTSFKSVEEQLAKNAESK